MEAIVRSDYKTTQKLDFGKGTIVTGVEVFKEGEFQGFEWTKEDLELIAANFKKLKEKADFDPPVRIGHRSDDSVANAKNVIGYIEDVYVKVKDGVATLFNDWDINDRDVLDDIQSGKYRKRSAEIGPYDDNNKNQYELALWGVGLVDIPQVEGLTEITLFSKNHDGSEVKLNKTDIPIDKEGSDKFGKKLRKESYKLLELAKISTKEVKVIKKTITDLDALLRIVADKEDWWDVSWIAGILASLKSRVTMATNNSEGVDILMTKKKKENTQEFDKHCVNKKIGEGMSEAEAKKACKNVELDKDEDEEEDEEKDPVEEGAADKGGEDQTDGENSDNSTDEGEKDPDEIEGENGFSKDGKEEMVTIPKSQLEALSKKATEASEKTLTTNFEKLVTEAKIPSGMKDKFLVFAKTLSASTQEEFIKLLSEQSPIVKLDKVQGKVNSDDPKDIEKLEAKSKAKDNVRSFLKRQGFSEKEIEKQINNDKKDN